MIKTKSRSWNIIISSNIDLDHFALRFFSRYTVIPRESEFIVLSRADLDDNQLHTPIVWAVRQIPIVSLVTCGASGGCSFMLRLRQIDISFM